MKIKHLFFGKKRNKEGISFLFVAFVVSVFFVSCQSKVSTDIPPELIENKNNPVMDATNFETTLNDSGIVRWHVTAPRLLSFPERRNPKKDAYYEFPDGFHMEEFDQFKRIKSELSGNYGKYYLNEEKCYATGNVVMVNNQGDTLRTEELNYHRKEDLIFSDKFVSIKKGGDYFTGTGFKSDAQMTKWNFMKAQGHVYMEDQ